jgi:hypothetical protein
MKNAVSDAIAAPAPQLFGCPQALTFEVKIYLTDFCASQ